MYIKDKVCPKCTESKDIGMFGRHKANKDGLASWCKSCTSISSNAWQKKKRAEDPKYLEKNREIRASLNRERYAKDEEFRKRKKADDLVRQKKRYHSDPDFKKKRNKASAARRQQRRLEDPLFAFKVRIRNLVSYSIRKGGFTKNSKAEIILGISYLEFIKLMDSISVVKYGIPFDLELMQIDHIVSAHNGHTEEQILRLNHCSNFQPLYIEDHKTKTKKDVKDFYDGKR